MVILAGVLGARVVLNGSNEVIAEHSWCYLGYWPATIHTVHRQQCLKQNVYKLNPSITLGSRRV